MIGYKIKYRKNLATHAMFTGIILDKFRAKNTNISEDYYLILKSDYTIDNCLCSYVMEVIEEFPSNNEKDI